MWELLAVLTVGRRRAELRGRAYAFERQADFVVAVYELSPGPARNGACKLVRTARFDDDDAVSPAPVGEELRS